MTSAFETVSEHAPAILFIDEFENIGQAFRRRDRNAEYGIPWSTACWNCSTARSGNEGVIVVAATNFADRIDGALLRSGRIETRIDIPLPDTTALTGILEHHLGADLAMVIGTRPRFIAADESRNWQARPSHAWKVEAGQGRRALFGSGMPPGRVNRREDWYDSTTITVNEVTAADTLRPLALLANGMSGADFRTACREGPRPLQTKRRNRSTGKS